MFVVFLAHSLPITSQRPRSSSTGLQVDNLFICLIYHYNFLVLYRSRVRGIPICILWSVGWVGGVNIKRCNHGQLAYLSLMLGFFIFSFRSLFLKKERLTWVESCFLCYAFDSTVYLTASSLRS